MITNFELAPNDKRIPTSNNAPIRTYGFVVNPELYIQAEMFFDIPSAMGFGYILLSNCDRRNKISGRTIDVPNSVWGLVENEKSWLNFIFNSVSQFEIDAITDYIKLSIKNDVSREKTGSTFAIIKQLWHRVCVRATYYDPELGEQFYLRIRHQNVLKYIREQTDAITEKFKAYAVPSYEGEEWLHAIGMITDWASNTMLEDPCLVPRHRYCHVFDAINELTAAIVVNDNYELSVDPTFDISKTTHIRSILDTLAEKRNQQS